MILAVAPVDNSKFLIITVVAIVFGLLFAGFLETKILGRLGWTSTEKAVGYVAACNMITPVLAFVFLAGAFAIFLLLGVKSFTNFQEQGALKISVYLLFPLLIVGLRAAMFRILKIRTGVWAWVYAFVSTKITFWLVFMAILIFYELFK